MTPIPAEHFRHMVKRDPGEPNLGDGTPAVPLRKEGRTIDITMIMTVAMGKPDSFTVSNTSDDKPYAGGIHVRGIRLSSTLVLVDGHGTELARIYQWGVEVMGRQSSYEIFAYRPFLKGQTPTKSRRGENGRDLFSWAKVSGDAFGSLELSVTLPCARKGGAYVETYVCEPHVEVKTANEYPPVIFKKTDGSYVAFAGAKKGSNPLAGPTSWRLHIAPGMDPCMIICFVAILDEYEKNRKGRLFFGPWGRT